MTITTSLLCDHGLPGPMRQCDARLEIAGAPTITNAALYLEARRAGWLTGRASDLCPRHRRARR